MLLPRLPLHRHRSSQLSFSCPLRSSSSRPCPLSTRYCYIPARPPRRSLFACCAKKREGKADGGDGQPSWARLWTGSQTAQGMDASQPSPPSKPSRPSPPPPRGQNSSAGRKGSPSKAAGGQATWSNSSSRSPPSSSSGSSWTPPQPPPRGRSSSRDFSKAGDADGPNSESAPPSSPRRLSRHSSMNRSSSNSRTSSNDSSSSDGVGGSSSSSSSSSSPIPSLEKQSSSQRSSSQSSNGSSSRGRDHSRQGKGSSVPGLKRKRASSSSSIGRSSSSSSSSSESESQKPRTKPFYRSSRNNSSRSSSPGPGHQGKQTPLSLASCLQRALSATQPQQCSKVLLDLGKQVQQDQRTKVQYSEQQLREIEAAAGALTATLLGSSSSSSSSSTSTSTLEAAPFQQLNSMQLSLTVWGFAYLAGCSSSIKTRQLHQLVDGMAVHAVESSVMDRAGNDGCMHWSRLLYSTAKLGIKCQDSQPVQQLFNVAAQKFPDMLHQKQDCEPQSISNMLWAFATAEYPGSLRGLVAEVASSGAQAMEVANSQGWSDTLWALGTMADRGVDLGERGSVDAVMGAGAASMAQPTRSNVEHYSKSLWGLAKAGCRPHDSITSKLAAAVAERSSDAKPQEISNTLWALATLHCSPDPSIVRSLAAAVAERSSDAKPQELSNTLWALTTLRCSPDPITVRKLAAAVAEHASDAAPQALSNTLRAVATLGCNPGPSTVCTLAAAVAERSSDANPQNLSNTLWALSQLGWYDARQIPVMVAALVQHKSNPAAITQHFSNALQALGSLRWYDACLYSQLVEGVLLKISSDAPDVAGQHLSNAMFSCALSCHFDSSVDALAEWGSQQSLQCWNEQQVSNALHAWAILSATAGGDTPSMRKLARHLFAEASKRGVAAFQARSDWYRDMGKLSSAHQEALHVRLPGGGVSDGELLQLVLEDTEQFQQEVSKELSHVTSAVSAALQGVHPAMVQGYHALLVHHPSCPHGIAIAVTHPQRDYLRHPAACMYGKTALRVAQMKRGCDGAVLCDETEVQGKSAEQLRDVLVQRVEHAARG